MSFKNIGLSAELLRAIQEKGYTEPTPIQNEVIPPILAGRDIMAAAQTGTGKTAGFTLPLLESLLQTSQKNQKGHRVVRALILTPTRELAAQVDESVRIYGKYLGFKSAVVYGGVKIGPQISRLRHGVDILVATPGRLLDLINQRAVNLSSVEMFVLDEADRMLDMGFIPDIRRLIELIPNERQTLLFSATFSKEIKSLANGLLSNPVAIEMAGTNTAAENIKQIIYLVDQKNKSELLSFLIGSNNWKQVLVFTKTKYGADRLAKELEESGLRSTTIHGNKTQAARTRALSDFKQGKARVLVATDVAARGLDIQKLPHVVNYDLPQVAEDYVHRIGRTGRAKNEGEAISLVSAEDRYLLKDIERLLKARFFHEIVPGFEPSSKAETHKQEKGRRTFGEGKRSRAYKGENNLKKESREPREGRGFSRNKSDKSESNFKKEFREPREGRGFSKGKSDKNESNFKKEFREPREGRSFSKGKSDKNESNFKKEFREPREGRSFSKGKSDKSESNFKKEFREPREGRSFSKGKSDKNESNFKKEFREPREGRKFSQSKPEKAKNKRGDSQFSTRPAQKGRHHKGFTA